MIITVGTGFQATLQNENQENIQCLDEMVSIFLYACLSFDSYTVAFRSYDLPANI